MAASERGERPVVLVTGVGRREGLGAAIALRLAEDGWDVATSHWTPYDERVHHRGEGRGPGVVSAALHSAGARTVAVPADLEWAETPGELFDVVERELGSVTALVMAHCESVDSSLRSTTVESFDRHFAVNARASWLLIRELAERFAGTSGLGRVVALTSDATVGNLPYGASKGALDRIVIAAARELADLRITSNVVNPGPVDTGWMSEALRTQVLEANPRGRLALATDTANLVSFLCSPEGGWVNGQLLYSDGGLHA
jgi:3-oxoacyl-[acyl-carrier protein] reductase